MTRGWFVRSTSPIDGAPLVAILTRGSDNPKTGRVIQSWILREDAEPREALTDGRDASICGKCPQRPYLGGRCYVRLTQGPVNVWRAYHRGGYTPWCFERLRDWARGDPLRLGSYGDPAMVPAGTWYNLIEAIESERRWTGFTHMWREVWAQKHKWLCMASVESKDEAVEAQEKGWRTYRSMLLHEPLMLNEFACPASKEQGKRLTCRRCGACNGMVRAGRGAARVGSVAIVEHGPRSREFRRNLLELPVLNR